MSLNRQRHVNVFVCECVCAENTTEILTECDLNYEQYEVDRMHLNNNNNNNTRQ